MVMLPRSYLFVPADRTDRIAKAASSGADAVIVDLEDAVAPPAKAAARDALARWLDSAAARPVCVRINAPGTCGWSEDLRLATHPAVAAIVVPKAEQVGDLDTIRAATGGRPLLPLVETAAGFAAIDSVARAPGVQRLLFGSVDFQADLGIEGDDDALICFRSGIVLASRLAGLASPVDGITPSISDREAVARDTRRARRMGFGGKLCIHPAQVPVVHDAFAPQPAELDWASRVVDASRRCGGAAVAVDGRMVDAPVLRQAHRLLARAGSTARGHGD